MEREATHVLCRGPTAHPTLPQEEFLKLGTVAAFISAGRQGSVQGQTDLHRKFQGSQGYAETLSQKTDPLQNNK